MIEQDQSLIDVLKWAVNPNLVTPAPTDLNHPQLLGLAQHHRILGPLVRRLDAERPVWFPVPLLTRLRMSQHQIWQSIKQRLLVAREISMAMQTVGQHPPIIIKGFAAHALTNHPDLLHFSSDIDPFAEDLPAFWDVTHALGYAGKRKDTHEWAKLTRGGVTLDVHQYYPINSYPADVQSAPDDEMQPSRHPGHWRLPLRSLDLLPDSNLIRWPDLAASAMPGITPGTENLLFPSPAMMCLIHCAHCFRTSVIRLHYINPSGGFRLFELLSIYHLAQSPRFDAAEFQRLVNRFSAQDAICFADNLLQAFLGVSLLERSEHSLPICLRFPEHLAYGGWVLTQNAEDFLLYRGLAHTFQKLGAMIFNAPEVSFAGKELPRLLLYGPQAQPPIRLDIAWNTTEQTLRVRWEALPIPDARQEFAIHFGYNASVNMQQAADGSLRAVIQKPRYLRSEPAPEAIWQRGATDILLVTCQVPTVPGFDPKRLPIFLAARQASSVEDQTKAACYVPLILQT